MTKTLYVTRGLPGSGKSTWAEAEARNSSSYAISRDELRWTLYGKYSGLSNDEENNITKVQQDLVRRHLKYQDVYVHDTCLPDKVCRDWRDLAIAEGVGFSIKDFRHVPLEVCLYRVKLRESTGGRGVPGEVIVNMYNRQIKGKNLNAPLAPPVVPVPVEVKQYVPDTSLPEAVLLDLDGTIADNTGVRGPYDTSKYHLDTVHEPVRRIVKALHNDGIAIIAASGRDETFADVSGQWLVNNDVNFDKLVMRPAGDKRNDAVVKIELFWKHIAPFYNVVAALDDRNRVVDAYRQIGIKVLQCQPGDF